MTSMGDRGSLRSSTLNHVKTTQSRNKNVHNFIAMNKSNVLEVAKQKENTAHRNPSVKSTIVRPKST